MNNIEVDRSTIGVLNTGSLEMVDSAVTVLKESGQGAAAAAAILEVTQAVLASAALSAAAKNEVVELRGGVAQEASAPKEQRRPAQAKALLERLGTVLTTVNAMADL